MAFVRNFFHKTTLLDPRHSLNIANLTAPCKAMGMGTGDIVVEPRVYDSSGDKLLDVLADIPPSAQRVLMVGHNPDLENLLTYLLGGAVPTGGKLLPTATIARLKMPDNWANLAAGTADLLTLQKPKGLPKKFPFPFPDGPERRDRPAYYYTQSSVIPYRATAKGIEILIVQSSQKKHWVVPKGIADPGHSLQESAAKEALEEAGVEGTVGDDPLGSYVYEKWGAACTCHVYPMAVTTVLPEALWRERHRTRQWLPPAEAAAAVRQPELGPMIQALAARRKSK